MTGLRLALASIEYPPDPLSSGIGTYTKTVATLLAKRGHKVFVVTRGYERADTVTDEDGVTVYRLTPARPELPELGALPVARLALTSLADEWRYRRKVARTLHALVEREHVDLIEAADHTAEGMFYRPERRPHVPFVVRLHTPLAFSETVDANIPELARRGVGYLERRFLQKATHLSAPSQSAAEAFLDLFKLERPVAIFPNPTSYSAPYEARATLESEDDASVLFAGRITRWKGVHLLMKAVPLVLERVPDARFILAGSAHVPTQGFPSTQAYLLSLVPEAHRSRVTFLGHVPHEELTHLYERATLCVFPSLFEAFGYTCLEAMTLGKAVIGSRNGGMTDLLDGGRAGKLFSPPDVDELAQHIVRLLQTPSLRVELGNRALKRVQAHYTSDTVMTQTEAFYRRAVAERQRADAEGNFTQH